MPPDNRIELDKSLADELAALLKNVRKSAVELSLKAAGIRNQYLEDSGKRYAAAFRTVLEKL